MSDSVLSNCSSNPPPLTEFPAEIAQLSLPGMNFVSLAEITSAFAKFRNETIDLKAELIKTTTDLARVGDELVEMAEKNRKIVAAIHRVTLDKQILMKSFESLKAQLDAYETKTTKYEDAFRAIGKQLKETQNGLSSDAHNTKREATGHLMTSADKKPVVDVKNTSFIEENKQHHDDTEEQHLKKESMVLPMKQVTVRALKSSVPPALLCPPHRANTAITKTSAGCQVALMPETKVIFSKRLFASIY
jgi:chromosome segregation ATPase